MRRFDLERFLRSLFRFLRIARAQQRLGVIAPAVSVGGLHAQHGFVFADGAVEIARARKDQRQPVMRRHTCRQRIHGAFEILARARIVLALKLELRLGERQIAIVGIQQRHFVVGLQEFVLTLEAVEKVVELFVGRDIDAARARWRGDNFRWPHRGVPDAATSRHG